MFSDDNPEDLEKTTKIDDEPVSEPAKKSDDWVTAPMPAAKPKVQPQPKPQAQPAPSPDAAGAQAPTARPAATSSRPAYDGPAPASSGGFGSFLSNFGIENPKTQQIVLIVGGAAILLCCLCVCLVAGSPVIAGFLEGMSGSGY
ncbi:MAG: hypothetical protein JXB30_07935 [Anaerolineae bacterium]|nr:hypothetical protein [Anaerolineae bacterium]